MTTHLHLVSKETRRAFASTDCLHCMDRDNFTFTYSFTLENTEFLPSTSQNPQKSSKVMYTNLKLDFTQIR